MAPPGPFPPAPAGRRAVKAKLDKVMDRLSGEDQAAVLSFAEFLAARSPVASAPVPTEPLSIPRPEQESVVGAIKRLTATYPMLDRRDLLNETSALMSQHVLQGREARAVIDELERLFRQRFEALSGPEA